MIGISPRTEHVISKGNIFSLKILLGSILLLAACGGEQYEGDLSYEIEAFTFTYQENEEVSKNDLICMVSFGLPILYLQTVKQFVLR